MLGTRLKAKFPLGISKSGREQFLKACSCFINTVALYQIKLANIAEFENTVRFATKKE